MKKTINFFVFVFLICSAILKTDFISAQDLIVKKNNETIKAKILEIGSTEIKYKLFDAPDGPIIVINKREIKTLKIHEENGKGDKVMNISEDPMSVGNGIILDKTSSIKFDFFSPLNHHLGFDYEWMIKPGFNWEAGVGIVGPGTGLLSNTSSSYNTHPKGFFIRTGPKFLLGNSSDIEIDGARYAHPLKGRYFKVEAILYSLSKTYQIDDYFYNTTNINTPIDVQRSYLGTALNLIYGRQYIFGNSITVGWYVGLGYAAESKTTTNTDPGINPVDLAAIMDLDNALDWKRYSHNYFGSNFPITYTAGFNVGYIFKTPEWISDIGKGKGNRSKPPSRHSME